MGDKNYRLNLIDCTSVKFDVSRLPDAKVIWINQRWMIESGMDPYDEISRSKFEVKLLNYFGVNSDLSLSNDKQTSHLYADRYGGTGGLVHGGSGRCGARGKFNAKGIGKTPLVNECVDIYHKNGYLSLGDALKEVVCSEISERELPWGAIPVVAIIYTGLTYRSNEGGLRTSAIIVRPNFIRPAHFQRSIYFGDAGTSDSQQYMDALRVKFFIDKFIKNSAGDFSLLTMLKKFANQIGAARALRLTQGKFVSSNVSIDGAIVDFGSLKSIPNWTQSQGLSGECFGVEVYQLKSTLLSIFFYVAKYSPVSIADININDCIKDLFLIENRAFLETFLQGIGAKKSDPILVKEICNLIQLYYKQQQLTKTSIESSEGFPWIDLIFEDDYSKSGRLPALENKILFYLKKLNYGNSDYLFLEKEKQFFSYRKNLSYFKMDKKNRNIEKLIEKERDFSIVDSYFNSQFLSCSLWAFIVPDDLIPISGASNSYSSLIFCLNRKSGCNIYWASATFFKDSFFFFGKKINFSEIDFHYKINKNQIDFELDENSYSDGFLSFSKYKISINLSTIMGSENE